MSTRIAAASVAPARRSLSHWFAPAAQRRWNVESAATGAALAVARPSAATAPARAVALARTPQLFLGAVIFELKRRQLRFLKGTDTLHSARAARSQLPRLHPDGDVLLGSNGRGPLSPGDYISSNIK
ncbi:hypothetical protein RR48_13959 [Papilio machaon]|uniref:Uncharacterized protein n=1 Tax=Papilio machaon TaxID=76193 RepID=A0A194RH04_PAPMA|nr:hypothetical protein RR48_13959 [Papilio machaon]